VFLTIQQIPNNINTKKKEQSNTNNKLISQFTLIGFNLFFICAIRLCRSRFCLLANVFIQLSIMQINLLFI